VTISQDDIDALLASAGELEDANLEPVSTEPSPGPERPHNTGPTPPPGDGPGAGDAPGPVPSELRRILRMRVPVLVNLADRDVSLQFVLSWTPGSIIEFDKPADSELRLVIANKTIGAGHAVKIGENFGLRVTAVGDVTDRIRAMGGV
jgi:flagellar motor switch protein FliN/FliY